MGTFFKMLYSIVKIVLKVTWKIVKFLCKPMWEDLKRLAKTSWSLYKEHRAKKAASADNSAESENLSAEGASEPNDDVGDSESSDSNTQS